MVNQTPCFAVGDPVRPFVGRAVFRTLIAAVALVLLTYVFKQIKPLYVHTPWMDDPYDAFVSWVIIFMPLLIGLALLRIPLCRRDQPLPVQRVLDLLRMSRLLVIAASITLLAEWISVALHSNRANWNAATAIAICLLALMSIIVTRATIDVRRASSKLPRSEPSGRSPDCLDDFLLLAKESTQWLGPWKDEGIRYLRWVERYIVTLIRSHPLLTAATAAVALGSAVTASQAIGEGIGPGLLLLIYFSLGVCSTFASAVAGGAYLGLIRSESHPEGTQRRLIDAVVVGCAIMLVAVAFRDAVWKILGLSGEDAGQLAMLMVVAAASAFALVFAVESLTGVHDPSKALGN